MAQYIIPRIPLILMLAVLALLVIEMVYVGPYYWIRGQSLEINQQQHSQIIREVDSINGRLTVIEAYAKEMQTAALRERMARLETNMEMVVRMFWAVMAGMVTLIFNAVWKHGRERGMRGFTGASGPAGPTGPAGKSHPAAQEAPK